MPEEKKKSKIRFARPGRRICKVVLPEFAVSVLFTGLFYLGKIEAQTDFQAMKIAGLALLLYAIAEVLLLRNFNHFVKSPTRYYCTNGLAFGILTLLAVVSACLNIGTIHTWLFLPFKLFYFPDWMSRPVSALVVGLLLFLIPVLYPPVHRWRRGVEKQVEQMGSRKKQVFRVILVPLFGVLLSLVFALVFMSGELASKEPTTEIQGSTMQITLPETSSSVSVPSSLDLVDADPIEKMVGYALLSFLIFLVAEGVMLWAFNRRYAFIRVCWGYLYVNAPPFLILILLAFACYCMAPAEVFTTLFLPFETFRFGLGTGRFFSILLVSGIIFLMILLYPLAGFLVESLMKRDDPKRPGLWRKLVHRYHKAQWAREHEKRRKEKERQKRKKS